MVKVKDIKGFVVETEIDEIEVYLIDLKQKNKELYDRYIENLKIDFIQSNDINFLNKAALVFSTFKLHSTVPLIIEKAIKQEFSKCAGTLLFSLIGLRTKSLKEYLRELKKKDISYEMEQMLEMLKV